jgi:hypothetical protein
MFKYKMKLIMSSIYILTYFKITWNYFLYKLFGIWIFSFLFLRGNNIGEKEAEDLSKGISSLANNCPLTNFSLNL